MPRFASAVTILALFTLPAFAQTSSLSAPPPNLRETIERQSKAMEKAYNTDPARLVNLYTSDAVVLPPLYDKVITAGELERFWKDMAAQFKNLQLRTTDVLALGPDSAREVGRYSSDHRSGKVTGHYVIVWRLVGPEWRINTDIWTTDKNVDQ